MTKLLFVAGALLALPACFSEPPEAEYELDVSPFGNPWLSRDEATLQIVLLDGYECPDGRPPRVYFVEPTTGPEPRGLGLLLHGGNFDYVDIGIAEDHFAPENRLSAGWGNLEAERTLGLRAPGAGPDVEGAWVAALVRAGYSVATPANCWGDLWHGTGDGDWGLEGFLRQGAYFADAALTWAQSRDDIDPARTLAIGLGEGGRGIVELALGVAGSSAVPPAAVAVDSSPDWLAGLVSAPAQNRAFLQGLERLYTAEIPGDLTENERYLIMGESLERDSLVHLVRDLGWRTPIFYAWSSFDERVELSMAQPAQDQISALYPLADHRVVDWGVPGHAPSNRDLEQTTQQVEWLGTHLP